MPPARHGAQLQGISLAEASLITHGIGRHGPGLDLLRDAAIGLSRSAGNRAVAKWLAPRSTQRITPRLVPHGPDPTYRHGGEVTIQRITHPASSAKEFIDWIQETTEYKNQVSNEEGACARAARSIGPWLTGLGYSVEYRGILFFSSSNALNRNHFVVVVRIGDELVVVDPTQGQFEKGAAQVAYHNDWLKRARGLIINNRVDRCLERRPARYVDRKTFDEANAYASNATSRFGDAQGQVIAESVKTVGCTIL